MTDDPQQLLKGFSRYLVNAELMDAQAAIEARENAKQEGIPLISYVVRNGLVPSKKIAVLAHQEFGLPLFDLDAINKDSLALNEVEAELFTKHHVLPLVKRGNRLFLAASDPTNQEAIKEIQFSTGYAVEIILVEEEKLAQALEEASRSQEAAMGAMLEENLENIDFGLDGDTEADEDTQTEIDEAPVVRFVNKILLDAINSGVSDIHFEPYEKRYRIRYRQDGLLFEKASPPVNIAQRLSSRLKVMARLNIAERRVPQDGRIKLKVSKHHAIDFRVNTCPTLYGEKVVLRILDASAATIGVDALGFEEDQKKLFMDAIRKPYGMILVTGPTGSGKTVSLYTALNILNNPEVNISTAEDPVEIQVEGINQVNINPASGLHFADALRAFLRQDPDIIMVGEIRDLETGEIAVKAAQTGHMVLSTLHTNDAAGGITRLLDMGVEDYLITSTVNGILAQRLVRRLCPHCKEAYEPLPELVEELGLERYVANGDKVTLYHPVGCEHCGGSGYHGRLSLTEVLVMNDEIRRLIMRHANAGEIQQAAIDDGMDTLRQDGLRKSVAGLTTLEEVARVAED